MRIAAISDIHARSHGADDRLLKTIHKRVCELQPDVFVIAGDLNEEIDELSRCLQILRMDFCPNLYVAGNHDVYFEEKENLSTLEKYSRVIGETCKSAGFIHLPDEPFVANDMAFIGNMGWYDYSFRRADLEITEEEYEQKQCKDAYWRDYYSIDWVLTDKEATSLLNQRLIYDLKSLPERVKRIVYVSHHLPFRDLTVYKDYLPWDFFSAYMGSEETGKILLQDNRVILTISGHSHIRRILQHDSLTAVTVPLGYGRPNEERLRDLVESAVAEIVINNKDISIPNFIDGDICEGAPYSF